jgi:hypothetical protein
VENLDSSELVEEHMPIKSENNDEDFDEECCMLCVGTQKLREILKSMSYKFYTMLH